jgi:transposase, IS5 family
MAHRTIGQVRLGFTSVARSCASLDARSGMIDWSAIAVLLAPIHASTKGELA